MLSKVEREKSFITLGLYQRPYWVCASRKGSGEKYTVSSGSLLYTKYKNIKYRKLMVWAHITMYLSGKYDMASGG